MEILIYYGKHYNEYFDASDKDKALKFLFTILDKEYQYYQSEYMDEEMKLLYKLSQKGDLRAIKVFMQNRSDHEYESWDFETISGAEDFKKRFDRCL